MNFEDIDATSCPVEIIAIIVGKKWIPTIIFALEERSLRLGELQRKVPECSKKILIQQLNLLIENKILKNEKIIKHNTIESYYSLTEYGLKLIPILNSIKLLGCEYLKISDEEK